MNHIIAICKKELKLYFNSPIAYVFITIFLTLSNWLFFKPFFIIGQANIRNFFAYIPWLFLFLLPAASMRLWSEEKKQKTIELLLTWPVKTWELVIGKFLASLIFIIITLAFSLFLPLSLTFVGNFDWGVIIASYLGSIFLAGTYLAIGLWLSSFTKNQIIAFIITVVGCFTLYIIGEGIVLAFIPAKLGTIFQFLGAGNHFNNIQRGVIDSRDILYYFSIITFFLYLNMRNIDHKKN